MLDLQHLRSLMAAAWASGAQRTGFTRTLWDMSGECSDPKGVEIHAVPAAPVRYGADRVQQAKMVTIGPGHESPPATLTMIVRCRRCDACRAWRCRLWTARARAECLASYRTWFGTLTLAPEQRFKLLSRVRHRIGDRGEDLDRQAPIERFRLMANEAGKEITKYLKRLRKQSGAPLRYLLVAEEHRDGSPHWHILVHEQSPFAPVRKSVLQSQWTLGFSQWKLSDQWSAKYVCKYLAKTMMARVRASIAYGEPSFDIVKETLRFLERENPDLSQQQRSFGEEN